MLHILNAFRKSDTLCDVYLVVDNCPLPAHRVVLAAISPWFKVYFTTELTGGKSGNELKVDIPEFRPDTESIEELLNFVYTGEAEIFEENVEKLFIVADFFHILSLREACAKFLRINLKPSNCLAIQVFAERYCQLLHEAVSEYICNHLRAIWKTEEFLSSDFEDVKDLICGERLDSKTQRNEEDVFDGIRSWVKHDPETREHCFPELFSHLRLSAMSLQFLTEVIDRDAFVTRSHVCEDFVTAELDARGVTEGIVLLSENGCTSCYIPTKEAWFDLPRLQSFNQVRAVTVCEGKVYAIGWLDKRLTIETFDPKDNIWSEVLRMESSLPMATTAIGDCMYLFNERGVTRYKPRDNSWQNMALMNSSRRGLCALPFNGLIYAIGGRDGQRGLNSVERYDPSNNQWEYVASMGEKRCFASATVMDNKILVVGGENYGIPLWSSEVYDPTTNAWSLLQAKLCVFRSYVAITSTRRRIFVFGGASSDGIVECYDKDQEEWTIVGRCPSTMSFKNYACSTWLPKALFKPLKGEPLCCGTAEKQKTGGLCNIPDP